MEQSESPHSFLGKTSFFRGREKFGHAPEKVPPDQFLATEIHFANSNAVSGRVKASLETSIM
jgi:hypothetical protein